MAGRCGLAVTYPELTAGIIWSGIRETNPPANRTALTTGAVASAYARLAINPLGTAIALHPFGQQAGLASALLGFLQ